MKIYYTLGDFMTGRAWIDLEQNIIDTAVNKWRKRLLACVCIVG